MLKYTQHKIYHLNHFFVCVVHGFKHHNPFPYPFLSCKTETLYLLNNNSPVITMNKGSNFSTSLPMLVVVCFSDRNHPNECEVIIHYSFYLHFPNVQWCWASFHVLLGYLYIFLVEISIYVLCLFLNQVAFSLLNFKSSLYTLYINALKINNLPI